MWPSDSFPQDEQAVALKQALRRKGQDAEVYVGMRYWKPFTEAGQLHSC
jgi:protoheme ferro-lyase